MDDKIHLTRQDDTLRYRAIAQRTLAQETVCIGVQVALLVSAARPSALPPGPVEWSDGSSR